MLQKQVINEKTFTLLKKIQQIPELGNLRLVGGTSLALQIGHRISVDLDLFGTFDSTIPLEMFFSEFKDVKKTSANRFMQFFEIEGVKVDFVNYSYKWLQEPIVEEEIMLASIEDIAAMKINAIINRGTKKDFIDMSFLLDKYPLDKILTLYQQKYNVSDCQIALRSLSYFEDAEHDPMPEMIADRSWQKVKDSIIVAIRNFT